MSDHPLDRPRLKQVCVVFECAGNSGFCVFEQEREIYPGGTSIGLAYLQYRLAEMDSRQSLILECKQHLEHR